MATAHAEQESANPVAVIRQNLQVMQPEFKAALPPHIPPERFTRVAMTAIQNTPALANADRRSLFGAFVKLAQDGLLPDGREAAVVMFGNKAQAMPMIGGILKRVRQSGEVSRVSAQVVYANDEFTIRYGFDEDVEHIPPKLDQPRGEPIGAYATAVLKDGSKLLEVMNLEEIEKVRSVSRAAKNGPWVAWWSEMARKTVMRRLSKRLPMSTDLEEQIFARDETLHIDANAMREIEKEPAPQPMSRLDAIEHQIGTDEPDPPVESEEIAEQAEELEQEIEQSPEVNDEHPATPKAQAIIAEVNDALAIIDVNSIVSRHADDIEAMPDELAAAVHKAADERKAAITAEREADAKAKEPSA